MIRALAPLAANILWLLSSSPDALAYRRAQVRVGAVQSTLLMRLLRTNAQSAIGRRYAFNTIRSIDEYRRRVPLHDYADYSEIIDQIGCGAASLLTQEPVRLLEPTSGSTAGAKLIPYTDTLKREFQRGIAPWVVATLLNDPHLLAGRAYWSVSPVAREEARSTGGIPIGFEEDAGYLGGWQRRLVDSVLAVPPQVKWISELVSFRYVTLLFLLRAPDLRLISIWNPTFLSLLVEPLAEWWSQLAGDIEFGTLTPPTSLAPDLSAVLQRANRPNLARARTVRKIFLRTRNPAERHRLLWPNLRLISCWADANAAPFARELAAIFPQARIQPKGLIATEAFVSLPLPDADGAALAVRSHFFEFLPIADGGTAPTESLLAHEVEVGGRYTVVVTTGGGFYRYRLHDEVEVIGKLGQLPLLRFVGKTAQLSDWFGEKLNERHAAAILDQLLPLRGIDATYVMLACEEFPEGHAYALFIQAADAREDVLAALAAPLDRALRENFHYAYCRDLGQLGPARIFRIQGDARSAYIDGCVARGQRAGDVKPSALHRSGGWSQVFRGKFLDND